jgi:mono/diheme cytochrome c family protein
MTRLRTPVAVLIIILLLSTAGCGSARRGEPIVGPIPLTSDTARHGQQIFMKHCQQCHPGGEAGLGPAINNKPLPGFLIRFQVRHGYGAMPAFGEDQIASEDLVALLEYLHALRKHG